MTDLKPCPFCGHDAMIGAEDLDTYDMYWVIRCGYCGAMMYDDSEDKSWIVERWNKRTVVLDGISVKTGMSKEELKEDLMEALKEGEK